MFAPSFISPTFSDVFRVHDESTAGRARAGEEATPARGGTANSVAMGCNQSMIDRAKSYVTKAETTVDDLPDILQKLVSAKQNDASKAALHALMEVAESDITASAVVRSGKIVQKLHAWSGSRDPEVKRSALACCAMLSLSDEAGCAEEIATPEFLANVGNMCKNKDKLLVRAAARYFSYAGGNATVRERILSANINEQVWTFMKSKDQEVMKLGVQAWSRIADDPLAAERLVANDVEDIIKFFFIRITKTDDTDVEKWCLIAVARLAQAEAFSEKLATMDKLPIIFVKANDSIAGRKLPAALCIANCAANKLLRVRLVKHRAFQLFVEMSKVGSHARKDMADFQRVAALGLRNLASNFDLRALAGKIGALEAVVKMLRSKDLEVARYAAKAASELSLHEENGRKMVLAGAFKPLIEMAKSGDAYCETEAVAALANLALTEDNQKQFQKEGGMAAIEVMTLSKNPRVQHLAKRLVSRMRVAKMKTAARFAVQMAQAQKDLNRRRQGGYDDDWNGRDDD